LVNFTILRELDSASPISFSQFWANSLSELTLIPLHSWLYYPDED
jgi:hypothetical protein